MKNRNLIQSFNNAVSGIIYSIRKERNMKLHIMAAVLVLLFSFIYGITRFDFLIICLTIALVLICELFNTAVEMIMDIVMDIYHPKVKIIKDIAAGAVLISAIVSLMVAYFVFFQRFSFDLKTGIKFMHESPIHIIIIALVISIIIVFVVKMFFQKGTPFQGGMPSGHSAIAFSIVTAVTFITTDTRIIVLCLVVSLLVIQSRLEAKIHSVFELTAGAALGFLITLVLFRLFY